ncbi:MAG: M14 family zinc carboxypeptidase [Steroidobacter sp.]
MAGAVIRTGIRTGAWLAVLAGAPCAHAVCVIDVNDEIANPFAPGCGDVIFTYTQDDNSGNNIALGFPVPLPIASLTPVDGFRTYDALLAQHQGLLTTHDEVAGRVVGQTVAGNDIWAYAIGDADALTADGFAEAAVLVNGGIHAREWQTPEAVTAVFEALIAGKSNAALEQYLVENLTTVLLPVNNVDGFIQTQLYPDRTSAHRDQPREGRMRRKNLRNPQTNGAIDSDLASVGDNFWGVDLNRNSAQGFAQANRSSGSLTSLIYRGAASNSEPELLALQNATTLGPASRLRFFSDTHSFSQVHFAPTTANARRNAITAELSTRMRAVSERPYRYSPDPQDSAGIGSAADHFAFTYQIPAWTFELEPLNGGQEYGGLASHGHSGFILPAREVARMRDDVTRMYLLGFYRQSGPPAAIAAQIRDTQSAEILFDARWDAVSASTRTQNVATNRALVPGRSYRLWIAFNKPMRVRDASGVVTSYRGQTAGASVGAVSLQIPSLANQTVDLGPGAAWLNAPGGAPNGYLHYADDAFAVDFTLPASINAASSISAVLALTVRDLAQMQLDANPATATDWNDGHWVRYENATNVEGDSGGPDCGFKPFIAAQSDAAPPATAAACLIAGLEPTPTPPPPQTPPARSGGGGGSSGVLFLAALIVFRSAFRWSRRIN